MLPIIPLLTVLFVLAFWYHKEAGGFFFRKKRLRQAVVGISLVINLLVLGAYTPNFSHRGLVEPLARLQEISPTSGIVFVSPERGQLYPICYAGHDLARQVRIHSWDDLASFVPSDGFDDYLILYPPMPADLPRYVDSLERRLGPIEMQFHVPPSVMDFILNSLNPRYNPTRESWVYRLESSK